MKKDRTLARILSFFLPGIGQVYADRLQRGILTLVAFIIGSCIFFIPGLLIWIWAIIDAGKCADEYNKKIK